MEKTSIWNIKDEYRKINFLFNFFMRDREINRIYRNEKSIAGDMEEIISILDDIIETITKKDDSREFYIFKQEANHRRIHFEAIKTREILYVKKIILKIFDDQCLSNNHFSWIDPNNDRICNFVYSYLLCSRLKDNQLECCQKITTNKNNPTPDIFLSNTFLITLDSQPEYYT